jgi:hypothetical protein
MSEILIHKISGYLLISPCSKLKFNENFGSLCHTFGIVNKSKEENSLRQVNKQILNTDET